MCGIVGYVGKRPCRDLLMAGLEKLEYRGYDSAGISLLDDGRIDSVRAVGNLANLRAAIGLNGAEDGVAVAAAPGDDRPRPHSLGHPRPGERGERPPARGLRRPGPDRPQRDRREPHGAAPRARGRGPSVQLRDRRRDRRPPDRAPRRGRPDRGGASGIRRAARPLRVRGHARRPSRHARRRAAGVPAGRRAGRRGDLRRLGDPGLPHPDPARAPDRERRGRHDRFRRGDGHRCRGQPGQPRGRGDRLGPGRGREGRLRDLHAEGDPRAGRRGRGDDHGSALRGGSRGPLRARALRTTSSPGCGGS